MSLEFVEYPAKGEHKATVIWLHGLGDSGEGFLPVASQLALPEKLGIRFVFPHAPVQPVTINGGMAMRSWYDIKSMDLDKRADEAGVRESAAKVEQLIKQELNNGIAADKIILAGFSQGGVISLHLAPRLPQKLAGVMALSTYMCVPEKLTEEALQTGLSVFMAHGRQDDVVPHSAGRSAFDVLSAHNMDVSWQDYPMAHQVCGEELMAIRQWLIARLN
ncbi:MULTISPECIES: dienelactone hydrolase family protein [unclassified Pseudoalteromonas]|uniref:alpha/beta hydrolase n=1 Tax=unclassified Pseudoalteromonas TaxID=194690 RepID=UPI0025B61DEF|nr:MULTISPECIES: dienelactone hydrolase family protein [unclassified Pseudoalteromonas]MDN3378818.1 dienelactone hydrolase family protein [Pseudoalteromonas sp. APC 3893]MDN3387306.1 dienelactone hydrolase family protein [Pseudoalteromonas sp. APC 4017]